MIAQGITNLRRLLSTIIEDVENELSGFSKRIFNNLWCELQEKETKVAEYDHEIVRICKDNELRLIQIEGIGKLVLSQIKV